jgi:hypothetical protein
MTYDRLFHMKKGFGSIIKATKRERERERTIEK